MNKSTMIDDPILNSLVKELKDKFHCHTVILYGSRARGDHSLTSDYDIAGISQTSVTQRIARFDDNYKVFHDIFIYSESDLIPIKEEHLIMADGKVIIEANNYGKNLLKQLNSILTKPVLLSENEIQTRKV